MERIELETNRLRLIPLGPEHLDTTYEYAADPKNTSMMVFLPFADREEAIKFLEGCRKQWDLERPEYLEFAIIYEGRHVGAVDFDWNADGSAEIGWILNPCVKGHGFAAEAATAMLEFMRTKLGIKRVIAHCDSQNVPSYRSLEKLGFARIDVQGGRYNRGSDEERMEYTYELMLDDNR